MTAAEFRAALRERGDTQQSFAAYLQVTERTVRRWAQSGPPFWVSLILGR